MPTPRLPLVSNGQVILIDIGLSRFTMRSGKVGCLVIEHGQPYALHRGTRLELPSDSQQRLAPVSAASSSFGSATITFGQAHCYPRDHTLRECDRQLWLGDFLLNPSGLRGQSIDLPVNLLRSSRWYSEFRPVPPCPMRRLMLARLSSPAESARYCSVRSLYLRSMLLT